MKLAFFPAAAALLAGCGYIGPILPPALDIPARITDLSIAQYGNNIRTDFTLPALTTEGLPLKDIRAVEVRVGAIPNPFLFEGWIPSTKAYAVTQNTPGAVDFNVPAQEWIGKEIGIVVRATGPKGKSSDWSNFKNLTISQPLGTPAGLNVENTAEGVRVTWRGAPGGHYRLFRAAGDDKPAQLDETDRPEYSDKQIEYGTRYTYYVQATEGELKQSELAVSKPLAPMDEFAPTVPTGLTADQGGDSINLTWERNTEARFRGYNVYRSIDGGAVQKVASLITAPAYTDRPVEAGKKYRYTVSAVGANDRESAQSAPVEVSTQ